ncbi:MAG: adenylylsulfate kinase, partial [Yoonia sp.]
MSTPENIHTEFHRMLGRDAKEAQLRQRGHVFWFYGL